MQGLAMAINATEEHGEHSISNQEGQQHENLSSNGKSKCFLFGKDSSVTFTYDGVTRVIHPEPGLCRQHAGLRFGYCKSKTYVARHGALKFEAQLTTMDPWKCIFYDSWCKDAESALRWALKLYDEE
eukprot:TRINITY_DN22249_c0_g1_i1.p1 TRINITY_DN22249_c0_g1~~TRINITY_DN22249_c0_g1_i1.p1  ORF type:complete len:127 (+),score=20.24 TRINITY_DN22249_c0_g1_i1:190-570(+)